MKLQADFLQMGQDIVETDKNYWSHMKANVESLGWIIVSWVKKEMIKIEPRHGFQSQTTFHPKSKPVTGDFNYSLLWRMLLSGETHSSCSSNPMVKISSW